MEMGIDDVINGIAIKLRDRFGYTIYVDRVPQDFEEPSFLIQLLSIVTDREIGTPSSGMKYNVSPLFDIQFFSDKGRSDLFEHSLDVELALERIELVNGDIILSTNKNSEIQDDICHNFMNFTFRLNDRQLKEYMERLNLNTITRGII